MASYNLTSMVVPNRCVEEAGKLLDLLFSRKIEHYRSLDEKSRAAILAKDPNYCHSIGYSERIILDAWRKTTLQTLWQELADEYHLRLREGKKVVVNDGAILSHFAFCGESWVKGPRKGEDVVVSNQVADPSKIKGLGTSKSRHVVKWVVVHDEGSKPIFMLAGHFIEQRKGEVSARALLSEKSTVSSAPESSVDEEERQKLLKQIEELRVANESLAARTPVESLH